MIDCLWVQLPLIIQLPLDCFSLIIFLYSALVFWAQNLKIFVSL